MNSAAQLSSFVKYDSERKQFKDELGKIVRLKRDEDRDIWISTDGGQYIRNSSRERDPAWIRIDGLIWSAVEKGRRYTINWTSFDLPAAFIVDFRRCFAHRLRTKSLHQFNPLNQLLRQISTGNHRHLLTGGVGEMTRNVLLAVFEGIEPYTRSYFRSCYRTMNALDIPGCLISNLSAIEEIRVVTERTQLEAVRSWHLRHGALTTEELNLLREATRIPQRQESERDHLSRLLLRIMQIYGRRPAQISGVTADSVYRSPYHARLQPIISFPGGKSQRNDDPRPYDLPEDLYSDLMAYSSRETVRDAQKKVGFFFVNPNSHGYLAPTYIRHYTQQWAASANIISPRTDFPLHVTPMRLRHTVATQLARRGWATEDIAEFLEHATSSTAAIYVDTVGKDLEPHLQRVNEKLNGVFSDLSDSFRGRIVSRPSGRIDKPIVVPLATNRSIIGQCGAPGRCDKNPFSACLGGCPQFLLFKDVNLSAAREWVSREGERWAKAERASNRSNSIDDFFRIIPKT